MLNPAKTAGLALAATGLAIAVPAVAAPAPNAAISAHTASTYSAQTPVYGDTSWEHKRGRRHGHDRRYYSQNGYGDRNYERNYYGEPVYRDTQVWRGRDGQYYCQKRDGTTGLLIGGAAGALLGREVAGRNGDRTLGAILGAAGGALLGRAIDRGSSRCR